MPHARAKRPFAGAAADPAQRQITSFFAAGPPPPPPARQPRLPAAVQAGLLSVGMRVRKSVPEGYKTAAPALWTDAAPELLPFGCVGRAEPPPADAVPALSLSQESIDSAGPEPPSRKRGFSAAAADDDAAAADDDAAAAPSAWVPPAAAADCGVSPRSLAPVGWGPNARVLAVPRPRLAKAAPADVGQENMAVDSDFDEADFLVYGEGRDMDTSP